MGPWYGHPSFTSTEASWVSATLILSSLLNNNLFFGSLLWPLHCSSLCFLLLRDSSPLLLALPFLSNRCIPHGTFAKVTWLSHPKTPFWLGHIPPRCLQKHFPLLWISEKLPLPTLHWHLPGTSGAEAAWSVPNSVLVLLILCPSPSPSHEPKQKWDCAEDIHVTSLISGY